MHYPSIATRPIVKCCCCTMLSINMNFDEFCRWMMITHHAGSLVPGTIMTGMMEDVHHDNPAMKGELVTEKNQTR